MLQQIIKELLKFLVTPTGNMVLLGLGCVIVLGIVYHRWRQIPGLTASIIQEDTWFINRDDNNKLAIVVSLHLINKSGAPIQFSKCKLSGYTPKPPPEQMFLEGYDKTIELTYPKYDSFSDAIGKSENLNSAYVLNPYTEQRMWIYYESGIVTLKNMLRTPIVLKDKNRKKKSIQATVPRNMEQIQLYREAAMRW
ncbi:MAG: hypothetical protein OXD54_10195 [Candidatus Poribacteria bacterium]|nr:hypothetical protein [Candidatus Poribacteria bacterium]